MPISRLTKLSKLFRQFKIDHPEVQLTWPPNKKEEKMLLKQTPRELPKKIKKPKSKRGHFFQLAKQLGYNQSYRQSSIKKLQNYLLNEGYDTILDLAKNEPDTYEITFLLCDKPKLRAFLEALPQSARYGIKLGKRLLPMNDRFFNRDIDVNLHEIQSGNQSESDIEYVLEHICNQDTAYITPMNQEKLFSRGGFFPFNLKPYEGKDKELYAKYVQTYRRYVREQDENYVDCLGHAISIKFPELFNEYLSFRGLNQGTTLQANRLGSLAKTLNIKIDLYKYKDIQQKDKGTIRSHFKGANESAPEIKLTLLENHYFLYEQTEMTSNQLNRLTNSRNRPHLDKKAKHITSLTFIKQSIEKNLVVPFTADQWMEVPLTLKNKLPEITPQNVNYIDGHVPVLSKQNFSTKPRKQKTYFPIYYDTETYPGKKGVFTVYQLSLTYKALDGNWYTITHDNLPPAEIIKNFFESIQKLMSNFPKSHTVVCVAHNLAFDIQAIMRYNLKGLSIIRRIGQSKASTKTLDCKYYGLDIRFQDSNAFLTMPLASFSKSFNLQTEKGPFPYDAMDERTVSTGTLTLNRALNNLPKKDIPRFMQAIVPFLKPDNKIDIIAYSKYYCELDVKLLREGFEIFRQGVRESFGVEIFDTISTPSLGQKILKMQEFYQPIPSVKGSLRDYINKTCVGGRTVTRDNKTHDCTQNKLVDLDVTSLYPYAFTFVTDVPISEPKRTKENLNRSFKQIDELYEALELPKSTWLFCDVNITKIDKPRHIPSLSTRNIEKGTRDWEDKPGRYTLNHIQLEDLCRFQEITFEYLGGIYYPKGPDDVSFKNFFLDLFQKRDNYKQKKNPLQLVYKLLMNSQHGKMTQNPIDTVESFKDVGTPDKSTISEQEYRNYLSKHYHEIIEAYELTPLDNTANNRTRYMIKKTKPIADHTNQTQVASIMYAFSKRIMNEVIYLAEDNNMPVYYTDTDSMFMDKHNSKKLEQIFKNKYGRDFQGKGLGFFHSDYDVDEAADSDTYAQGVFFGKKAYFLQCHYKNRQTLNNDIKMIERMKGVPNSAVREYYRSHDTNHYDLMTKISKGEEVTFDLTTNQVRFNVNNTFEYSKKDKFTRTVQFKGLGDINKECD